jgi:hypothetical protein
MFWPIALASYFSVIAALVHWLTDSWSGAVLLGMAFAIFFGTPMMAGYAGYLWTRNKVVGLGRVEVVLSLALPFVIVVLAGLVIAIGRVRL